MLSVESKRAATVELIRLRRQRAKLFGRRLRRRPLPRLRLPDGIKRDYYRALADIVDKTRALLEQHVYPHLPALLEEAQRARTDAERMDAPRVSRLIEMVEGMIDGSLKVADLSNLANRFGARTADFGRAEWSRQVRAGLGVDAFGFNPKLEQRTVALLHHFADENAAHIKSIPWRYLERVEKQCTAAVREGRRWESLALDLRDEYGIAERRANLIARDQVGKLYGEVQRAQQESLGLESYVWRTCGDNRVREEHEERDGQPFRWDDPPDDGHPGEPVLCRCWAEPDFTAVLEGLRQ